MEIELDPVTLLPVQRDQRGQVAASDDPREIELNPKTLRPVHPQAPAPDPYRPDPATVAPPPDNRASMYEHPIPPTKWTPPRPVDATTEDAAEAAAKRMRRTVRNVGEHRRDYTPEEKANNEEATEAFVRSGTNTVTFGLADRGAAVADTMFNGGTYADNLAANQQRSQYLAERQQGASLAGAAATAIIPGSVAGRITSAVAGKAPGIIRSAVAGATGNAATGAVEGAMRSSDLTDARETGSKALGGAVLGGLAGGGLSLAGRAAGGVKRLVAPEKLPNAAEVGAEASAGTQRALGQRTAAEARELDAATLRTQAATERRMQEEIAQRAADARSGAMNFPPNADKIRHANNVAWAEKTAGQRAANSSRLADDVADEARGMHIKATTQRTEAQQNQEVADRLGFLEKARDDASIGQTLRSPRRIFHQLLRPGQDNLREQVIPLARSTPAGAVGKEELERAAYGVPGEHYARRLMETPGIGHAIAYATGGKSRGAQEALKFATGARLSDYERKLIINSPFGKQLGIKELDKEAEARILRFMAAATQAGGTELMRK